MIAEAPTSVKLESVVDRTCDDKRSDLAISIAVSCMAPHKQSKLGQRCGSAPTALCLFGQRPLRRSPQQTRRTLQRRRSNSKVLEHGKSMLDLSSLDFSLREPSELEELHVGENEGVDDESVAAVARSLSSLRMSSKAPLKELQFSYQQIGDDGVSSVCWAAMQGALTCLTRLVLTGNRITRCRSLATAFRSGQLPSLAVLYLSSNRITSSAVCELALASLPGGTSALFPLTQLWLDHNEIGWDAPGAEAPAGQRPQETSEALGAIARACPRLEVLGLGSNGLRDAHLGVLAQRIADGAAFAERRDSTQARLELSLNNLTFSGICAVQGACAAHGSVRVLV